MSDALFSNYFEDLLRLWCDVVHGPPCGCSATCINLIPVVCLRDQSKQCVAHANRCETQTEEAGIAVNKWCLE